MSLAGLEASPKDLRSLLNILFPRTLRPMQSIFGSLIYYSRFVEDFEVYASVLYELCDADFNKIGRTDDVQMSISEVRRDQDRDTESAKKGDPDLITGGDRESEGRNCWEKVALAFVLLQNKLATTPVLKHFDPYRYPVIVVYASK